MDSKFCTRDQRVRPIAHQHSTCVSSSAVEDDSQGRRSRDRRDDSDRQFFLFQHRTLFDVQFDKSRIEIVIKPSVTDGSFAAGGLSYVFE
jgi:hypothetical protein